MLPIPLIKPEEVLKALKIFGWEAARLYGSHIILVKEGHIAALSVPNYTAVARGTLRSLIARAGIPLDKFLKALKP